MRCGCRPRPPHLRPLPPGPARPALVGSLETPLALSHTCTVAGQLEPSCNTSAARASVVFLSPSCSKFFLRICRRGWCPSSKGPHPHIPQSQASNPSPAQRSPARPASGSVVHSRGPEPQLGRQQGASAGPSQRPHFGSITLSGAGDFRLRQRGGIQGGPRRWGRAGSKIAGL